MKALPTTPDGTFLRPVRARTLPPSLRLFLGWAIVFVLGMLLPLVLAPTGQQQTILGDMVEAETYAMLALGLNVVVGFAGLLDLGYAAFYAIGAYSFGMISSAHFQPSGSFSSPILSWNSTGIHGNFWIFLPLMALMAGFFGVVLGAPTLRLRGDYLAIVTLGFGEIVHDVVINMGGNSATTRAFGWPDFTGGSSSLDGIFQPQIGPLQFTTDQVPWYYLGLFILAVIISIAYSVKSSRLGRAWAAMREDELAAACMGINITRTKLLAFSMGAFFSGFAGVFAGSRLGEIDPNQFTFAISISILVMVVLGGIGSIPGVVLGATVIALIQFFLLDKLNGVVHGNLSLGPIDLHYPSLVPDTFDMSQAEYLIFGILLVLMMLFRREGLIPSARRSRELYPEDDAELLEENQQLYTMRHTEV
jgi:branched-chain amino acid transport system permease protein